MSTVLKAGRTRKFAFKHELAAGPASKITADEQHTERYIIFYPTCHYAISTICGKSSFFPEG